MREEQMTQGWRAVAIILILAVYLPGVAAEACDLESYFDVSSSECKSCNDTLDNCDTCKMDGKVFTCTACSQDTTFSNGKCVSCSVLNCLQCSEARPDTCLKCKGDFEVVKTVRNVHNYCSVPNCSQKNPELHFDGLLCSCSDGLFLQNGNCVPCLSENCQNCKKDKATCESCAPKYYLDAVAHTCTPCIENCLVCSNAVTCLVCTKSQYLNSSTLTCSSVRPVVAMTVGWYNESKMCGIEGCANCLDKMTNCIQCQAGFMLVSTNGTCKVCADGCAECKASPIYSVPICTRCYDRNQLLDGRCVSCKSPNCLKCSNNIDYCTQWAQGYGVTLKGAENQCPMGCKQCFTKGNLTLCGSCGIGYFKTSDSKCLLCKKGDIGCSGLLTPLSTCRKGFIMINGSCLACIKGCRTCEGRTDKCTSCKNQANLEGQVCVRRVVLPCVNMSKHENHKKEVKWFCSECYTGYNLKHGKCWAPRIKECNKDKNCTTCPLKYSVFEGQCLYCDDSCYECSFVNKTFANCLHCAAKYYAADGVCESCTANCKTCINAFACTSCEVGFFMTYPNETSLTGECEKCNSNCKTCDTIEDKCASCNDGFQLENSMCFSLKNVTFNLTFDTDATSSANMIASITSNASGFLTNLSAVLTNDGLTTKVETILILSLGGVPVLLSGSVSYEDQSVGESLKDALFAIEQVGQYTVKDVQATAYSTDDSTDTTDDDSTTTDADTDIKKKEVN